MIAALQTAPILQPGFPAALVELLSRNRLPGMRPCEPGSWIERDAAFAGQMVLRDRLIAERSGDVHALTEPARDAAEELYEAVVELLSTRPDYHFESGLAFRPDGVRVALDPTLPLLTLGRLVQEDLCLMQEGPNGHVLTGAILAFPASWSLSEKLGRPLPGIHQPVPDYDDTLASRVQRLFNAIRPGQPLERANLLSYSDSSLYQPRSETARRTMPAGPPHYWRSERQCLVRLPISGAVVFSIHTYVIRAADLPPALRSLDSEED